MTIGSRASVALSALSAHFDRANDDRFGSMSREALEAELRLLHRTIKVGEEFGEVVDAVIGATGSNPRKGVYGSMPDVVKEELDVALTALGNVEHMTQNRGLALAMLEEHILSVTARAGVVVAGGGDTYSGLLPTTSRGPWCTHYECAHWFENDCNEACAEPSSPGSGVAS